MENQIYRKKLSHRDGNYTLEFFIADTNDLNPCVPIKEIGICIYRGGEQIDGSLDFSDLESLVNYLVKCEAYIKEYNEASRAEKMQVKHLTRKHYGNNTIRQTAKATY